MDQAWRLSLPKAESDLIRRRQLVARMRPSLRQHPLLPRVRVRLNLSVGS